MRLGYLLKLEIMGDKTLQGDPTKMSS